MELTYYNNLFIVLIGVFGYFLLKWAFNNLPEAKWQILAIVPKHSNDDNEHNGVNITYYGFFNACAYTLALAIFIVLTGSVSIPFYKSIIIASFILAVGMPISKIMAMIIEKKSVNFTLGGAYFITTLVLPIILWLSKTFLFNELNEILIIASLSVSYCFGESIGRLACISFGCCYGAPLNQYPQWIQKLFKNHSFVFEGKTKKISYHHNLDGQEVLPIQAITSTLLFILGIIGMILFFNEHYILAIFITGIGVNLWRFVSEFFRMDYRGTKIFKYFSSYQLMAILSMLIVLLVTGFYLKTYHINHNQYANVILGLKQLFSLSAILLLQLIWFFTLLYTGISKVTFAKVKFFVARDRI